MTITVEIVSGIPTLRPGGFVVGERGDRCLEKFTH